ncbi:MAG: YlbF family regulator [Clostridiales bacterium]|nr:YlbF family regulator [Clostridiales bacterium]
MNVYEQAHGLAQSIRESEEYKQYMALKVKIDQNPEISSMIKDFERKNMEQQTKQMMGEKMPQDMAQQVQDLYGILMKDPSAAEYLQAEIRFSLMMSDVYKVLADAVGLGNE